LHFKGKFLFSVASSPEDCSVRFTSLVDLFNKLPSQHFYEACHSSIQPCCN